MTPMHLAAYHGNIDVLHVFKDKAPCLDNFTLYYAIINNQDKVIDLVIKQITNNCIKKLDYLRELQVNSFRLAVYSQRINVLKFLSRHFPDFLSNADSLQTSSLHIAIYLKNVSVVEFLISEGANVSVKCKNDKATVEFGHILFARTRFSSVSCPCGYSALHFAVESGIFEIVQLLIKHGADLQTRDCEGTTLLHVASHRNYYTMIRYLVTAGAKVKKPSFNGSTPLHSAALGFAQKAFETLIFLDSDKYQKDNNAMLPYHYIVKDIVVPTEFYFLDFYTMHPAEKMVINAEKNSATKISRFPWFIMLIKTLINFFHMDTLEDHQNRTIFDIIIERGLWKAHKLMRTSFDRHFWHFSLTTSLTPLFFLRDKLERSSFSLRIIMSDCCSLIQDLYQRRVLKVLHYGNQKKDVNCYCGNSSPLLVYLETGGRHIAELLIRYGVKIPVKCGMPFNRSPLHMVAFHKLHYVHYLSYFYPGNTWKDYLRKDNVFFDYFFYNYSTIQRNEEVLTQRNGDGPVTFVLREHEKQYNVLNNCRDLEGYTPLQRAAQGANIVAIKRFLDWGANIKEKVGRYDALTLSVLFSIKYGEPRRVFGTTSRRLPPRPSILTSLEIEIASHAANTLLHRLIKRRGTYDVGCKPTREDLSIYHLAAARGMHLFVRFLFVNNNVTGLFPNCYNKYGVTPLFLAKLFAGTRKHFNPWLQVVKLMLQKGATLSYPDKATEFQLLRAVFNHHLFSLDSFLFFLNYEYPCKCKIINCSSGKINALIFDTSNALLALKEQSKLQPFLNNHFVSLNKNISFLTDHFQKIIYQMNKTIKLFDDETDVLSKNLQEAVVTGKKTKEDPLLRERCDKARIDLFESFMIPLCSLKSYVNSSHYTPRASLAYMKKVLRYRNSLKDCSWQHLIIKSTKQILFKDLENSWNAHFSYCEFHRCSNFLFNRFKRLILDVLAMMDDQLVDFMTEVRQKPNCHELLTYGMTPPLP